MSGMHANWKNESFLSQVISKLRMGINYFNASSPIHKIHYFSNYVRTIFGQKDLQKMSTYTLSIILIVMGTCWNLKVNTVTLRLNLSRMIQGEKTIEKSKVRPRARAPLKTQFGSRDKELFQLLSNPNSPRKVFIVKNCAGLSQF